MILWDSNLRCLPVCQKSVSLIGPKKKEEKKMKKKWKQGRELVSYWRRCKEKLKHSRNDNRNVAPRPGDECCRPHFAVRFLQKQQQTEFPWHALATLSRGKHFCRVGVACVGGWWRSQGRTLLACCEFSFFVCYKMRRQSVGSEESEKSEDTDMPTRRVVRACTVIQTLHKNIKFMMQ